MATFNCADCGHTQSAPDEYIGKHTRCPSCDRRGTIVEDTNALTVVPHLTAESDGAASHPEIRRCSGGSIQTRLGYGIVLNKHSSIKREWITVAAPNFPARLIGHSGIKTVYDKGDEYTPGSFYYDARYTVCSHVSLHAIEVRWLTFDFWGCHVKTLSATEIQDMDEGKTYELNGRWSIYSENEASEHYASIAYVAQIRTAAKQVFVADVTPVLAEARKMSDKFSESDLDRPRLRDSDQGSQPTDRCQS